MEKFQSFIKDVSIGTNLYNNSYMSDVRFEVEGEIMYAHKFLLSYSSEMFYTMFHGSIELKDSCIKIEDLSKHVFGKILKYMYTHIFDTINDLDSLIQTLYGAKKYMLKDLIDICIIKIANYDRGYTQYDNKLRGYTQYANYDSGYTQYDNIFRGYTQYDNYDRGYTQYDNYFRGYTQYDNYGRHITQTLLKNEKFVFDSDGFLNSPITLIKNFITSLANTNKKTKEISEFLIKWAKNECCKRQISNDLKNILCILSDNLFISYILDSDLVAMIDLVREQKLLDDTEILKILIEKKFRITCQ
ncbi:uncharacterized protein LOC135929829 [Gordionus sp. m RMFG-2023]|uniref:uncharacterized protein LOC135929829 n=1 Tax=Gordionus sp. m RMFG-2023 TaxID=3053472 RepID=UPI0031FCD933